MILNKIKNRLLLLFEKHRLKRKVRIGKGCTILQSTFEGYNTIFKNSSVYKSYIGMGTYVGDCSHIVSTKIGRFCSIAENVRVLIGNHPTSVFVTTYPSFYYNTDSQIGFTFHKGEPIFKGLNKYPPGESDYHVVIGNDVWIGCNCLIIEGVKIGDGAVIGAGAVVTKDVAPYSVVAGVPAKVIKYRFMEEQISFLLKIEWWNWPVNKIEDNYMSFSNINDFINKYKGDVEY